MDTIAACSTPVSPSAIAIIRISGDDAEKIYNKIFRPYKEQTYGYMRAGKISVGNIKDTAMGVVFDGENSFTGETTAELYIHGSVALVDETLRECFRLGARQAERGEFTRRAFLNGKIDLTAAEGINNLINSVTVEQAEAAAASAEGGLFKRIAALQKEVLTQAAAVEAALDYPDEVMDENGRDKIKDGFVKIKSELEKIKSESENGRILKEGVKVVLAGEVNVGKSSLINALCGKERAIVSAEAGTTRDYIEEDYIYNGRRFTVTDTAGLRTSDNAAENVGIEKARELIKNADVVVYVSDREDGFINYDVSDKRVILVRNKSDMDGSDSRGAIKVSAKTGEGIDELKRAIYSKKSFSVNEAVMMGARQYDAVIKAIEITDFALNNVNAETDLMATELKDVYDYLGRITGEIGSDEIIDAVFRDFCVGK